MKFIRNSKGYTITELMLALLLTGIISAAGFQFYVKIHNQALIQGDISEMQHNSRATLQEISKTLRMAGYRMPDSLPAYRINGDSLYVFYSDSLPVDSVLFYLADYYSYEINGLESMPLDYRPKKLMKQVNSNPPVAYTDNIHSLNYNVIDSATVEIVVEVQTVRSDEDFNAKAGLRTHQAIERVNIRNLLL